MSDEHPMLSIASEFFRRAMADQDRETIVSWLLPQLKNDAFAEDGWTVRTAADALKPHPPLEYLVDQSLQE